jgi:tetratricopeptide (TPR) repeat protein
MSRAFTRCCQTQIHRVIWFCASVAIATSAGKAQGANDPSLPGTTIEISGQVRSSDRRAPLSSLVIRLESQGSLVDQTSADGKGSFRFPRLKRGSYTITIKLPGYVTAQQTVDLQTVSRAHVLMELVPEEGAAIRSKDDWAVDARVPPEARKAFEKGRADWQARRLNQALDHLNHAVEIYPAFFDAQLLRGLSFRELEKWPEAESALKAALALSADTPKALVELGEVYRRTKRFDMAEEVVSRAITLKADDWQANFTLARVFWETGRFEKAKESISRAVSLNDGYAEAHLLAGNIAVRLNDFSQAVIEYETYLRLAPKGSFADQARELVVKLKGALAGKQGPKP